jgi:hypothetical protein
MASVLVIIGQASGFRLQASGFRLQASGFRLQASGFRLQASGFRLQRAMLNYMTNFYQKSVIEQYSNAFSGVINPMARLRNRFNHESSRDLPETAPLLAGMLGPK